MSWLRRKYLTSTVAGSKNNSCAPLFHKHHSCRTGLGQSLVIERLESQLKTEDEPLALDAWDEALRES